MRQNGGPVNGTYLPSEMSLAKAMQFYWSQFAKSSKPGDGNTLLYNNGTKVEWIQFQTWAQNTVLFEADDIQLVSKYDQDKCVLWDEISYPWMPHP